jgi:hypothetical protein
MTIEPQLEDVQDAGVMGAAGADMAGVDDIDIPPPQALKAAVSKAQAAAANQRLPFTRVWVTRVEFCIEISLLCWFYA